VDLPLGAIEGSVATGSEADARAHGTPRREANAIFDRSTCHLRRNRPMRGSHPAVIGREPQTGARPAPLPIRNPGLHIVGSPAAKRRMLSQKGYAMRAAGGGVANGAGYQRTLQRSRCGSSAAISARKGSESTAAISSSGGCGVAHPAPLMFTSRAAASRSSEPRVGMALPFFNLEMYVRGTCHASGKLALAQVARAAHIAHLAGHLQPASSRSGCGRQAGHKLRDQRRCSSTSRGGGHFLQRELMVRY